MITKFPNSAPQVWDWQRTGDYFHIPFGVPVGGSGGKRNAGRWDGCGCW